MASTRVHRERYSARPSLLKSLVVAVCLLQTVVPLASDARIGGKETALGYGDALIDVPDGWSIDKGTVYLELVTYVLKPEKSSDTTMRIVLSASSTHEDLGPGAQPYCRNGLSGETLVKDGMRTIRLDIPAPPEPRPNDSKAILSFRSSDGDAERVAATLHLKGPQRKCPHSERPHRVPLH